MKIIYKSKTAEKQFSPAFQGKWKYPQPVKIKLLSLANALEQAPSLHDIANIPTYRFHPLIGDRKCEWSLSVGNTGYRVTVIPCDAEGNEIVSGDVLAQCKMIKVVKITEVSNHYE